MLVRIYENLLRKLLKKLRHKEFITIVNHSKIQQVFDSL